MTVKREVIKTKSIKTRCIKVVYEKNNFVKICGRFATKFITIESYGISYKLDLCKECFKEFEKKENEEEPDEFIKTSDLENVKYDEKLAKFYSKRNKKIKIKKVKKK